MVCLTCCTSKNDIQHIELPDSIKYKLYSTFLWHESFLEILSLPGVRK